MVQYNNNRGGGGVEQKGRFLLTRIFYIFMCTVMLLIHLLMSSGSVECTS